jgi:hypothetical protein
MGASPLSLLEPYEGLLALFNAERVRQIVVIPKLVLARDEASVARYALAYVTTMAHFHPTTGHPLKLAHFY